MKAKTTGSFIALTLAAAGAFVLVASRAAAVEAVYPVERAKRALAVRVWSRIAGLFRASAANAENILKKFSTVLGVNYKIDAEAGDALETRGELAARFVKYLDYLESLGMIEG